MRFNKFLKKVEEELIQYPGSFVIFLLLLIIIICSVFLESISDTLALAIIPILLILFVYVNGVEKEKDSLTNKKLDEIINILKGFKTKRKKK